MATPASKSLLVLPQQVSSDVDQNMSISDHRRVLWQSYVRHLHQHSTIWCVYTPYLETDCQILFTIIGLPVYDICNLRVLYINLLTYRPLVPKCCISLFMTPIFSPYLQQRRPCHRLQWVVNSCPNQECQIHLLVLLSQCLERTNLVNHHCRCVPSNFVSSHDSWTQC